MPFFFYKFNHKQENLCKIYRYTLNICLRNSEEQLNNAFILSIVRFFFILKKKSSKLEKHFKIHVHHLQKINT